MSYFYKSRILPLGLLFALSSVPAALNAQQRTWTLNDGVSTFHAELVNAYGSTVYFHKEDDGFIHLPITFLAPYDIARVLEWANKRDAHPQDIMMNSSGQVTKDVCKQWPNRIDGNSIKKDEDINNLTEPRIFTFLFIKKETNRLRDLIGELHSAELKVNESNPKFMETVVITPLNDSGLKVVRHMIAKAGGAWLMPDEYQYKDNNDIWNGYWRNADVNILVIDPQGNVLCDGSAKELDGKPSDPIAFLNEMAVTTAKMGQGWSSVPNQLVNNEAVDKIIASFVDGKDNTDPAPLLMGLSGIEPDMLKQMEGKSFMVEMLIDAKGRVETLTLNSDGDSDEEEAMRRAATLWQFVPVIKNGVPETKTVIAPIVIKAPQKADAAK